MKISELKKNETATIIHVCEDKETCRLCSMGFSIGQKVTLLKNGHNLIIKVGNTKFAMNSKCLDCFDVKVE